MEHLESTATELQKAIVSAANHIQKDQEIVAASAADYANADVSATASVDPNHANLQGWITYRPTGGKIFFEKTKITSAWGAGAAAGFVPLLGALPSSRLAGKTGTFEVVGWGLGANLQMWIDGQPVLRRWLPLAGGGTPWGWGFKGEVRFTAHA